MVKTTYRIEFIGESETVRDALNAISTYYIDGGGEDAILENLDQNGITGEKLAWDDNEMVFQVTPKR